MPWESGRCEVAVCVAQSTAFPTCSATDCLAVCSSVAPIDASSLVVVGSDCFSFESSDFSRGLTSVVLESPSPLGASENVEGVSPAGLDASTDSDHSLGGVSVSTDGIVGGAYPVVILMGGHS